MITSAVVTVNLAKTEYDVPWKGGTLEQLAAFLQVIRDNQPDATSFVVTMTWA